MKMNSKYLAITVMSLALTAGYSFTANAAEVGNVCYIKAAPEGKTMCCAIYDIANNKIGEECKLVIKGTALDHCKVTPGSRAITCDKNGKVNCVKNVGGVIENPAKDGCPENQPGTPAAKQGENCPDWLKNGLSRDTTKTAMAVGDDSGTVVASTSTSTSDGYTVTVPYEEVECFEATDEMGLGF